MLIRKIFKQSNNIQLRIGTLISHETYSKIPPDIKSKSKLFMKHVYPLAKYKTAKYFTKPVNEFAHPECRQRLRE
jgi:hypothetical protein